MANKEFIYGLHAVTALLQKHPERIIRLSISEERSDKKISALLKLAKEQDVPVQSASKKELDGMTNAANHQGVVAFCEASKHYHEEDLDALLEKITGPAFILILDSIQDPHNLGACFRTADAAGVHIIIVPKDKSVGLTPVVTKVASGATETVPFVQVTNLVRTIEKLKERNIWIYGAAGDASQSLYATNFSGPIAIVLGAEGEGLRHLTREHCDFLINIPMQGSVSSLNVSVATGIFLFEVLRQRNKLSSS